MKRWLIGIVIILISTGQAGAVVLNVPDDYLSIQAAIDASVTGDTVMVAPGRYPGEVNFNGKEIMVASREGPETCIIDCTGQAYGFQFTGGETDRSILTGFTIRNATSSGGATGGALRIFNSSPIIADCVVMDNAMYYSTTYSVEGVSVAGILCDGASPLIVNCLILNNVAYDHTLWSSRTVCGAIYLTRSSPVILNCTIAGNFASSLSAGHVGGVICEGSGTEFTNCILWDNGLCIRNPQNCTISYCNLDQINISGEGNIRANPVFTCGPLGEYYLSSMDAGQPHESPSRNAGLGQASTLCFMKGAGPVCLDKLTTKTDDGLDSGRVDQGYHYRPSSTGIGVRLHMPGTFYKLDDPCHLKAFLYNNSGATLEALLFIALEFQGSFYFWDGWTSDVDYRTVTLLAGMTEMEILPEFSWPDVGPLAGSNLIFWGLMTDPAMTRVLGDSSGIWRWTWGF